MDNIDYYAALVIGAGLVTGTAALLLPKFEKSAPNPPSWIFAAHFIWDECYEVPPGKPLPKIKWVKGERLNCSHARVAYNATTSSVQVAVEEDSTPVSQTALAHALRHLARKARGLDPDPEHRAVDWLPDGIVAHAKKSLIQRGW